MRGLGRSSGAISVVNAVAAGVGCAAGVRLYVVATLELEPAPHRSARVTPESAATPIVLASLDRAIRAAQPGGTFAAHLELHSEVPVAKGLKSSSAASTATICAVRSAFGQPADDPEVARLAAAVNREAGGSATGAFDDALAGLAPGFVVTDNRVDRLLRRVPADPEWTAVVHVPAGEHPPSASARDRFRAFAEQGKAAGEAALKGDWSGAMRHNTEVVERAMGYDYAAVRHRLEDAGAVACGVSGMGPALVALTPRSRLREVLASAPEPRFAVDLRSEEHP